MTSSCSTLHLHIYLSFDMVDYCCHMILLILLNISSPYCGDQTDNSTKGLEAKVLTAPLRVFYPLWEKGMYSIQEFGLFNPFKIILYNFILHRCMYLNSKVTPTSHCIGCNFKFLHPEQVTKTCNQSFIVEYFL